MADNCLIAVAIFIHFFMWIITFLAKFNTGTSLSVAILQGLIWPITWAKAIEKNDNELDGK